MEADNTVIEAGANDQQEAQEQQEVFDPSTKLDTRVSSKYESQLRKEYQQDDFKGIEDINSLYAGYRKLEKESMDALHIPTEKSTPEEIKGFFTKIGMPDDMSKYDLPDFDLNPDDIAQFKADFREAAFRSGLTKGQAAAVWMNQAASVAALQKVLSSHLESAKETYDARYDEILAKDYPDLTRRAERKEEEGNLYQAFLSATGIGAYLDKTGLSLNPEFRHMISSWYQRIDPSAILGKGSVSSRRGGIEDIYTTMA